MPEPWFLHFAAGRNAARGWAERQDRDTLFVLERFIQKGAEDTQFDPSQHSLRDLIVVANELQRSGHPEQAEYFADLSGARGWVDGFLSYVRAGHP